KRQTTVLHAVFNRAQLACSTALASAVFAAYPGDDPPAGALLLAVVGYQASNWLFVAVAEWSARGVPVLRVLRKLVPSGLAAAATYLALGLMGVVLGLTSVRVGPWAVALLMLPLLGARHAVNVSGQLEQAERERRALADRLIDERERERVRIASDIHDVVLQQLAALQLEADSIGAALDHDRRDVAVRLAVQLRDGVDETIAQLRGTIASLRRTALDQGGLVPSLDRFARTFRASSGVPVEVRSEGVGEDVPLPVTLLVLECCQEALTNVARHAGAEHVSVDVTRTGGAIELKVTDDGAGFDPEIAGANRAGLALTREKVALAGGILFVQSRPGVGTTVTVRVPVWSQ
ncbi:MAG: sensor histidine kinase, partial [Actinomycetota bacterium]|nr:sensor histidine kinase [Actinomycetota bacterium]